jgi:hypothetical protein
VKLWSSAIAAAVAASGCCAPPEPVSPAAPSVRIEAGILRYIPGDGNIVIRQLEPDGRIALRSCPPQEILGEMDTCVFRLRFLQPPPTTKVDRSPSLSSGPLESVLPEIVSWRLTQCVQAMLTRDLQNRTIGVWNYDPDTAGFVVRDRKIVLRRLAELFRLLDVDPEEAKSKFECVSIRFGYIEGLLREIREELCLPEARDRQLERLKPLLWRLRNELNRVHDNPAIPD